MIKINSKYNCVGCYACKQVCPTGCITMIEDHEGFIYPKIDKNLCADCSLCENVCPVIQKPESGKVPQLVFGAKNKDPFIREQSSSGGIFTLLAEGVINQGGVVFGAKFDKNWDVIHGYSETLDGLSAFRGSKYVQSRIGETFKQAKDFLKQGRKVLFSGTPCQIAGLNLFLKKKYENLLTVDFICHGVPSPLVWRKYIEGITKSGEVLKNVNFRNKKHGWKHFSFSHANEKNAQTTEYIKTLNENIFLRGFLRDLYLRPSCHECPAKELRSNSNITIADFWGIEVIFPEHDDDKGHSLVLLNDDKAIQAYEHIKNLISDFKTDYNLVRKYNKAVYMSICPHKNRELFFEKLSQTSDVSTLIEQCIKLSLKEKSVKLIRRIARNGKRILNFSGK